MKRIVIGITGRKYSGKNTAADALEAVHGNGRPFFQLAMASPLKEGLRAAFELTDAQLWGEDKEVPDRRFRSEERPDGITSRELMQGFGEWARTKCKDIWIVRLREKMAQLEKEWGLKGDAVVVYVITDVRHFNEADAVQRLLGGKMVRIERPSASTGQFEDHESERYIDQLPTDYVISNTGTLDDLNTQMSDLYKALLRTE